ncbi:amidohydrolase family protein [Mesorhizobium sp. NBSH29]|uniref:amidohydrolase n=1 Tax=Mesorhizobium sp. NBSH29 TaxID=2654249 RepID=UPI0018967AFC|nr:amidohydrolase [Mesorhizobium sp. NBSH29]QPC86357.1 amidohydrolase family protein [Mesorhizobium sp. NBSH29]
MNSVNRADLVLHSGKIWTGYGNPVAEAISVVGNKVLASGSNTEIMASIGPDTKIVDLAGRFAMPGLNDAHLHLISTGLLRGKVDATPDAAPTRDALLTALQARAAETPKGEWVTARGFDQTRYADGQMPTARELDAALPDHPVSVTRACGHVTIVNSLALALAGIDFSTPDPDGGLIGREGGELTGMLAENAQNLVYDVQPTPSLAEIIDAIEAGGRHLLEFGITSCMDAAVGQVDGMTEIEAYRQAEGSGRLPVRVWATLLGDPGSSIVDPCHAMGLVTGSGSDMFRIGGVKIFTDGSAGGRTAWMRQHYIGQPDNFGIRMLPDTQLFELVDRYTAMGYTMVCHGIGDAAIDQLVRAYERVRAANPDHKHRHRIEHCGYVDDAINQRMLKAGILPAPQQVFIYDFGDAYVLVLGPERGLRSYPIGTWERLGMKPSTGSDSPVCSPNPFPDLYAMLTRKTHKGTVMDASEKLTPELALRAYTEHGAYSQGAEAVKGRLEAGMLADIAVFSNDLLTAAPETILRETRCVMTILDGRIVYEGS